jgi:hypothetical protein
MKHIGIVGAGIAGLHLGLFLQQHNVDVTLYSERTPEQIRASQIANLVIRFDHTRQRERTLGVDHWDFPDFGVFGVHMYVGSQPPIQWSGALKQPARWICASIRPPCSKISRRAAARSLSAPCRRAISSHWPSIMTSSSWRPGAAV